MAALRVAILDAHSLLRETLTGYMAAHADLVPLPAPDPDGFLHLLASEQVDVALVEPLLDPRVDDCEPGFALLARARHLYPSLRIIVLTRAAGRGPLEKAYELGAMGFCFKPATPPHAVLDIIRGAARGERRFPVELMEGFSTRAATHAPAVSTELAALTDRERDVLLQIAAGHDNLKIAALLGISERTVKSHVAAIYRKMHVENRVQLALRAMELGLGAHRPSPAPAGVSTLPGGPV